MQNKRRACVLQSPCDFTCHPPRENFRTKNVSYRDSTPKFTLYAGSHRKCLVYSLMHSFSLCSIFVEFRLVHRVIHNSSPAIERRGINHRFVSQPGFSWYQTSLPQTNTLERQPANGPWRRTTQWAEGSLCVFQTNGYLEGMAICFQYNTCEWTLCLKKQVCTNTLPN